MNGRSQKSRVPPGSAPREENAGGGGGKKDKKGRRRNNNRGDGAIPDGGAAAAAAAAASPQQGGQSQDAPIVLAPVAAVPETQPAAPLAPVEADPVAKKIRNLSKKLKAIDDLKAKLAKGDKLEATQLLKIKSEGEIRGELAALEK